MQHSNLPKFGIRDADLAGINYAGAVPAKVDKQVAGMDDAGAKALACVGAEELRVNSKSQQSRMHFQVQPSFVAGHPGSC